MSNSDYTDDANDLWVSRKVVDHLKKQVLKLRRDQYKGVTGKRRLGHLLAKYFKAVDVTNKAYGDHKLNDNNSAERFQQEVLNGIKPLLRSKSVVTPKGKREGAALLALLSDLHPEIAKDILGFAADETRKTGKPVSIVEFRPFQQPTQKMVIPPTSSVLAGDIQSESTADMDRKAKPRNDEVEWAYHPEVSPPPLPPPKTGETWKLILGRKKRWTPLDYLRKEIFSSEYIPFQAVWTRNRVLCLYMGRKYKDLPRIYSLYKSGIRLERYFKHIENAKYYPGECQIVSAEQEGENFVLLNNAGFTLIKPSQLHWRVQTKYGDFIHCPPTLKPISGDVEKYNRLPVESYDNGHEGINTYDPNRNHISISQSGRIIHSTFLNVSDTPFGEDGPSLAVWQADEDEEVGFSAEVIPYCDPQVLGRASWSASERYVAFEHGLLLSIEKSKVVNLNEVEASEDKLWFMGAKNEAPVWHPTRDVFATISERNYNAVQNFRNIEIWLPEGPKRIRTKETGKLTEVTSMDWSPDGTKIAFTHSDRSISVWNLETDEVKPAFIDKDILTSICFSPDSQRISMQAKNSGGEAKEVVVIGSENVEIAARFAGRVDFCPETPWHYESRHLAYEHEGRVCIRELQFD